MTQNNVSDPAAEITHRRILQIAVPIVLSNATVPILGAVDTGVVGQMGEAAPLGAVGIGTAILSTIFWIFGFLRMGTTALAAQARGAGDLHETGAVFMRGFIIACAGGITIIAVQYVIMAGAFWLAPASEEVETLAQSYMRIRFWGAPATIALFVITGWLIAVERTRGVLVLQLWMNGLNIVLDIWFVLGLNWGVQGVAIATLIAEWTGLLLGLWLCKDVFGGREWRNFSRIFNASRVHHMLVISRDILIRSVILSLSFLSFLFLAADFGDVTLAANQILLKFLELTAYALDGFAFSAEALVGTAVGSGSRDKVRQAALRSSQWGVGGAVVLCVVFLIFGPLAIDIMTTSQEVRDAARGFLIWAAISPVLGIGSWMFDGIYFGATWTSELLRAMYVSVAIYVVAVIVLVPWFGNHGLWAALMVLNVARCATLWLRYPKLLARVGAQS